MTDATKQIIGKASRRITVALAGALGFSASQVESPIGQIAMGIVAFVLMLVAEYFSARHDTKIVERAIEVTMNNPESIQKMMFSAIKDDQVFLNRK